MESPHNAPPPADGANIDAKPDTRMDDVDRRILSIIQSGFPLETHPYAVIGQDVGVSEEEAFARVREMRERGLIRRIGANFQSGKLGYHSTLCAARVPEEKLESFIAAVNTRPGVTHNYLREHELNVWFTCIGPSKKAVAEEIAAISGETGVPVLNLPATRLYKIKVDFRMDAE